MSDAGNVLPTTKKRAAGRELSRDNPGLDDEEISEEETRTFKRATDEVLASRRIVKVRRQQTTSAPSSNPFAGIRLVPPPETTTTPAEIITADKSADEKPVSDDTDRTHDLAKNNGKQNDGDDKQRESKADEPEDESATNAEKAAENDSKIETESAEPAAAEPESAGSEEAAGPEEGDEKAVQADLNKNEEQKGNDAESKERNTETTNLSSFQQLSSSKNAFTGLAGTGATSSPFSFGSTAFNSQISGDVAGSSASQNEKPAYPFASGLTNNGSSSIFGKIGTSVLPKSGSSSPSMKEVPVETGEENEEAVFQADSVLFEFIDGGWKERGKGEIKVNVSKSGSAKARLVMRVKGNYRLILNASLYADMKFTSMDKKGITFACVNSTNEGNGSLSTFALKFRDASIVEEFRGAVTAHTGKGEADSKAPEPSPKASEV